MSHRQIFRLGLRETRWCKINLEDEHGELDWFRPSLMEPYVRYLLYYAMKIELPQIY
jgi:hypothetical protein